MPYIQHKSTCRISNINTYKRAFVVKTYISINFPFGTVSKETCHRKIMLQHGTKRSVGGATLSSHTTYISSNYDLPALLASDHVPSTPAARISSCSVRADYHYSRPSDDSHEKLGTVLAITLRKLSRHPLSLSLRNTFMSTVKEGNPPMDMKTNPNTYEVRAPLAL